MNDLLTELEIDTGLDPMSRMSDVDPCAARLWRPRVPVEIAAIDGYDKVHADLAASQAEAAKLREAWRSS